MYGASGAAPREARGHRERPDVLPAPASLDTNQPVPRLGKDSVARLTLTGLSYVVTVSMQSKFFSTFKHIIIMA